MSLRLGLTVSGGREAERALRELPIELQKGALYAALHRAAGVVQQAVQAAAPQGTEPTRKTRRVWSATVRVRGRRTKLRLAAPVSIAYDYGRLRQNIRRRRANLRQTGEIAVSVTRGRAFWAFFLEQGTRRMRPHPFWQNASRRAAADARAEFEAAFRAAVQRHLSRGYTARAFNR